MLKHGLYARKSDDDTRVTEKSLADQVAECRRVQEANGLAVVRVFEESRSAKVPHNRPLWAELIKNIKTGRIDAILCWNINRLVRNMEEGGELVQLFIDGKIREIRTPHSLHRSGDNILPLVIEAATATQFSIDLRNVVRRSMHAKSAAGGFNGMAPQGYLNARDPMNRKLGLVVTDPERFPLIRKAWELMLTGGCTVERVADTLNNSWGYRTRPTLKRGHRPLTANGLYNIFRSPFYAGFVSSKGELVRATHEGMVSTDEFSRVQEILGRRAFRARRTAAHPFTGIMHCAYCGQQVTAERKVLRSGKAWDTYHCPNSFGVCTSRGMSVEKVGGRVIEVLEGVSLDADVAAVGLAEILRHLSSDDKNVSGLLAGQEAARATCRAKLERLYDMWLTGLLTDRERYSEIEARELATLNDLTVGIERSREELRRMRENARRAHDYAAFSQDKFKIASPDVQRSIARALGAEYHFYGLEKTIEVIADPLLLEFVAFSTHKTTLIESGNSRSSKRKQTSFEKTFVYGGPADGLNEPSATGADIGKPNRLPEKLLEALRGPLFPDLWLGQRVEEGGWEE